MGFSGGGSNVLLPHTHDGLVAGDGGSLQMDNVTQGGLTSGDIVYSDGVHLQRLAIGNIADSLTVNGAGTFPEWAAGGASGSLELLYATRLTTAGTFSYTPGSALLNTEYSEIIVVLSAATAVNNVEAQLTVNSGLSYHVDGSHIQGAVQTLIDLNGQGQWNIGYDFESNRSAASITSIMMGDASYTGNEGAILLTQSYSGGSVYWTAGGQTIGSVNSITNISVFTSSGDYQTGSRIAIYGRKIT